MRPTDLDQEETSRARARLTELADAMTEHGQLRDPRLRQVFESTWRHPYVPSYYPAVDRPPVLCVDPSKRADWLDAVYSDVTLITKIRSVPLSRELGPATGAVLSSSSTLPSLMLGMVELLDLRDGCRVLEIGTGTGYNAALLCGRVGAENVTTIDVDAELVDLAQERLADNGLRPTVAVADGALGYPDDASYDRIIATCSVRSIPTAWLSQAVVGAVIVTDIHGPIGGTLARLTVAGDGTATGRFVPHWAGFMPMRHADARARQGPLVAEPMIASRTDIDPRTIIEPGPLGFLVQWHLPDVTYGRGHDQDGRPTVVFRASDGSRAQFTLGDAAGEHHVAEYGDRRLLPAIESAVRFFRDHDRPSYERFGITATATGQFVWFDGPDGPSWPLPAPESLALTGAGQ